MNFIIEATILGRGRFRKALNDSSFLYNGLEVTFREDKGLLFSTFYVSVYGEVEKVQRYVSYFKYYVEGVE